MNFPPSILLAASSAGITEKYYDLCNRFPFKAGAPLKKVAAKEVLNSAQGTIQISKLAGPGTVFQLDGLPNGVSLNFIIQSGGTVETDFSVSFDDLEARGTFAILCNEAMKHQGLPAPNPAYPRPICSSAQDLVSVFKSFRELALLLLKGAASAG